MISTSSVLNINQNIDIAADIAFWNIKHNDISNIIAFNIFWKIMVQYRLGPHIAASILDAK